MSCCCGCTDSKTCLIERERRRIRRAQAAVLEQLRTGDTDVRGFELLEQLDAATRAHRAKRGKR